MSRLSKPLLFSYNVIIMIKNELTNISGSPLRYPGGKGKISRFVGHVLEINDIDGTYVEPFAGGAGVAVNLLLHNKVNRIIINDLDEGVYEFWKLLVSDPNWLIKGINKVPFDYTDKAMRKTPEELISFWSAIHRRYKLNQYTDMRLKGFDFFMLNRMNVSGIIKGGPIGGHNQDGTYNISARFNKKRLKKRIRTLSEKSEQITVVRSEASFFLGRLSAGVYGDVGNCLVFVDPPYYVQGKNLYNSYATTRIHELIADKLLKSSNLKWLLTYDEAPQINQLYPSTQVNKYRYQITYSANKRGRFGEYMFAAPELRVESYDNVELRSVAS